MLEPGDEKQEDQSSDELKPVREKQGLLGTPKPPKEEQDWSTPKPLQEEQYRSEPKSPQEDQGLNKPQPALNEQSSSEESKSLQEEEDLNEPQPALNEQGSSEESKPLHFHKSMASIFGQVPFFKSKFFAGQKTGSDKNPTLSGKLINADLIFRVLFALSIALVFLLFLKYQQAANVRLTIEGKLGQVTAESVALKASVEDLREKAKTASQLKAEFEKKRQQLANELDEKEKKIEELTNQLSKSIAKTGHVSKVNTTPSLKSPTVQFGETSQEEAAGDVEGKILVVKPASNMAVVNLGKKDNVKIGSIFYIYNLANNYIGNLVIDEIEDTLSIGKISPENISPKVREDYIVKLRRNL